MPTSSMPIPNQQPEPSKPCFSLKTWQWVTPIVILAALVGGYFVYQNYFLQKTTREMPASAPAANQSTEAPESINEDDSRASKIITAQGNI